MSCVLGVHRCVPTVCKVRDARSVCVRDHACMRAHARACMRASGDDHSWQPLLTTLHCLLLLLYYTYTHRRGTSNWRASGDNRSWQPRAPPPPQCQHLTYVSSPHLRNTPRRPTPLLRVGLAAETARPACVDAWVRVCAGACVRVCVCMWLWAG